MDTLLKYADFEDISSAFELIYDYNTEEDKNSIIFSLYHMLAFLNFGCIKDTDNVITITSQYEYIAWTIAYLYTPRKLVTHILDQGYEIDKDKWNDMKHILSGYHCTMPMVSIIDTNRMNKQLEYPEELYDVAIIGVVNKNNNKSDDVVSRFYFDGGNDFDLFEILLVKSSNVLRLGGILVLLAKPAWILKVWTLLDELGLHLGYDSYKVYRDQHRHPNVFVWLRFVKIDKEASIELHKKNVLSLMYDNEIDRLYAHRNNLMFPYVELSYHNAEAYVEVDQNLKYLQYFFSVKTTKNLADLCVGYTACLVTPSVAQYAYKSGKNPVLFERDNRFRENGGCKFVKYDLNTGLIKLMQNRYRKKFDCVICDPPFDIRLEILAKDIDELLKEGEGSNAYVVFPYKRSISLINAMKVKGLKLTETMDPFCIEYAKPPKLVRINGKDSIQLYKFTYSA